MNEKREPVGRTRGALPQHEMGQGTGTRRYPMKISRYLQTLSRIEMINPGHMPGEVSGSGDLSGGLSCGLADQMIAVARSM
ncbi:MAG TPA: hypothetical protein PKK23_20320, partial [Nitrospirales bacterium]|nr:hypothetical protein [Nitrospirales bacterium]